MKKIDPLNISSALLSRTRLDAMKDEEQNAAFTAAVLEPQIDEIREALVSRLNVLVLCDLQLRTPLLQAIAAREASSSKRFMITDDCTIGGVASMKDGRPSIDLTWSGIEKRVFNLLTGMFGNAARNPIVVLKHLDLIVSDLRGDVPPESRHLLRALVDQFHSHVLLAFYDPSLCSLPKGVENLFSRKIAVNDIRPDRIARLLTQEQAKLLSSDGISLSSGIQMSLHKALRFSNPIRGRTLLNSVLGPQVRSEPFSVTLKRIQRAVRIGEYLDAEELFNKLCGRKDGELHGQREATALLKRKVIEPFKLLREENDPDEFERISQAFKRGVILYGPSGEGKTVLAAWVAKELDCSVRLVSIGDIKQKYAGEAEKIVTRIFDEARKSSPSILIFDEMDALFGSRNRIEEHTMGIVNSLLTEMSLTPPDSLVLVIGTTNRVEGIDQAFRRRFPLKIKIKHPHPNPAGPDDFRSVRIAAQWEENGRPGEPETGDFAELLRDLLDEFKLRDPDVMRFLNWGLRQDIPAEDPEIPWDDRVFSTGDMKNIIGEIYLELLIRRRLGESANPLEIAQEAADRWRMETALLLKERSERQKKAS